MAIVFLSYSSQDESKVARLEEALRGAGHQVLRDRSEIHAGDLIPERINHALSRAEFVVVCLSGSALASGWARNELNAALMAENSKGHPKLLARIDHRGRDHRVGTDR